MRQTRRVILTYTIDRDLDEPPDWYHVFERYRGVNGPRVEKFKDEEVTDEDQGTSPT